jgi:hypothetical protein
MFRILLLLTLVVLAGYYWPVMSGGFVIDDYVFIAQSRMVDAPRAAFFANHFYEPYYFRPIGVVNWWLATYFFDLNYAAHSAINLALHAANVVLVATPVTRPCNASAESSDSNPLNRRATVYLV